MDNKKFEQLINLIINEDEEKARALFHNIVVEKSREIYESIMDEEMMEDMEEGMGGQVGEMMDEITAEEMSEDEDSFDDLGDEDEIIDIDADEMGAEEEGEEVEDAVVRIEDKLDQLMAEFEDIMGGGAAEEDFGDEDMGDEDMGAEDMGDEDMGDEDMMETYDDQEDGLEEEVMEAITLKKVSVTHGDNGQQTRSTVAANSGARGMASKPVRFVDGTETVPTSAKGPTNAYSKGETQVKGAGQFKNAPAQASQNLEKAPAPKKGDAGSNAKSPVAESRRSAKKIVK